MNCGIVTMIVGLAVAGLLGVVLMPVQMEGPVIDSAESVILTPAAEITATPAEVEVVPVGTSLSCEMYPLYCVPFVGDDANVPISGETPATRTLDQASAGVPGVLRGITAEGAYFIGDPTAPIRFKVFHNFGCGHCRTFANGDLQRFIESHVLTGQAGLEVIIMAFGAPPYPTDAVYAAMCAGEQGAFWEMEALLFEKGRSTLGQIIAFAAGIGLDEVALRDCVMSEQHADSLQLHETLALDYGVTATPTVMYSVEYGEWTQTMRAYDNLVALTEAAPQN